MGVAVLTVSTAFFAIMTLKWKFTSLVLSTWLEKNQCKEPTREDLQDCAGFVLENLRKKPTSLFH